MDREGRKLGRHTGTYNFTIGQRKGLGIASTAPLYVIGIEADGRRSLSASVRRPGCGRGDDRLPHPPWAVAGGRGPSSGALVRGRLLRGHVVGPGDGSPGEGDEITVVLDEPAKG